MYNIIWVTENGDAKVIDTADSKEDAAYWARQYREAKRTGLVSYELQPTNKGG